MPELEIIALSGVVYRVNSTGPSTEPCGAPYVLRTGDYFVNKKKNKFEPAQIFYTSLKNVLM